MRSHLRQSAWCLTLLASNTLQAHGSNAVGGSKLQSQNWGHEGLLDPTAAVLGLRPAPGA